MPEGPQGTEIIIGRAIPPDADFVFTSTNAEGDPGGLNRYVAEETKYGAFEFDRAQLADGFTILRRDGYPTIVVVVTVGGSARPSTLLQANTRKAIDAIAGEVPGRSVWLPLMGTGQARIPPAESLQITIDAIRATALLEKAEPSQLALSVGPEVDDDTMRSLAATAAEAFGDTLHVLDAIADATEKTDDDDDDYVPNFSQESVRRTQQFLSEQGYTDVPVNGVFDAPTRDAMEDYKQTHGIDPSVGPSLFLDRVAEAEAGKSGSGAPAMPPIEVELTRDLVRNIQQALTEQGHGNIFADGMMGAQTRTAIRRFQAARGEEPTGIVTLPLIDALGVDGTARPADPTTGTEPPAGDDAASGNPDGPTPPPEPEPAPPDATAPFYPDHPAQQDSLGRRAIAEAIATIVNDAWRVSDERRGDDVDRTFMVHIHGRWGSGKSSILNFLREILQPGQAATDAQFTPAGEATAPPLLAAFRSLARRSVAMLRDLPRLVRRDAPAEPPGTDWIVVDYNAWRNQGRGPAWWTLMNRVYADAFDQLGGIESPRARLLKWSDIGWRIRSGWLPYAIVTGTAILLIVLLTLFIKGITFTDALKLCATVITVVGGVFAFGSTYRIGSARTASTFLELTRDPLRPLTERYDAMVGEIGRPVAVFIDDLDRCNADFVVELLQSVQTLYRHARVLYVVAADRDWICCSYEQVYDKFQDSIGEAGRPLGHLFLEKIFQLSITVPNISRTMRREYWARLVSGRLGTPDADAATIEAEEKATIETLDTEAEIRAHTEAIHDPVRRRIAGAQAFSRLQTTRLRAEREHFLTRFATLIEPNPRAMKRLVNAYGFKRGFELMAGSASPAVPLVHWTILELRWPALAAHLARHPQDIAMAGDKIEASADPTIHLLADPQVIEVARELSPDLIRTLIGDGDIEAGAEPSAA